ncbi:ADP-ribosylation factor-like protein 13B-like [Homarus americanus]|uniref:ADP-ribosylation factor-like protein 13B-like n=1 Tax=Homarus americanus TaxID=6706 RepID=A0A8J5JMU4_HOMAM|nr:ADP-ribosylation factor-like protein 13B-like [Homarus americanus]
MVGLLICVTDHRPVTLLLVGLDNAGKTTAAKSIVGDPVEDVAPTVGFAPENLEYRGCEITIYDLGGGNKIRPDVEGALDEIDLVESLNVEQVVNKYKCPTRVETCSAVTTRKHKPDKPIADGFRWLIDTIVVHYKEINKRVEDDLEKERLQMMKEREERKERIRRLQAERERQEALRLETMSRGKVEAVEVHNSDDSDVEVVDDTQHPGRSGVPNGSPPASNSPVRVQASPSPEKEDSPVHCPPTKPHRVIHVQESPKHQAASAQDLTEADSLSNGVRKGDSRFLEANSFYNINGYSASKFDLSHEERTDECVPIDSDDDTCNSSVSSHRRESTSPFTVHTSSNPSILSYSKAEQLELETTYKPSKKKSFLKRYHKTAPFIPNGSASTAGNQEVNHSSRVPPSLS